MEITKVDNENIMVWFYDKNKKVAVTADIQKYQTGWKVITPDKKVYCITSKNEAVKIAKRIIKNKYEEYKNLLK